MKNYIYLCIYSLILVSFTSCGQLIDDTYDDFTPTPILIGVLEADSTFIVHVGITANLSDTIPKYVNNALVIIESTTQTPDTLKLISNGQYASSRLVKAGETYTCIVKMDGFKTIKAQTTIPVPTKIDSVHFTEKASVTDGGTTLSSIDFLINNIPSKSEYWEVGFELVGKFYDFHNNLKTTYSYYIHMDAGQDTVLLHEATPLTLFSDKYITSSEYKARFLFSKESLNYLNFPDDKIDSTMIVLKSVDKSYYEYVKKYYIYQTGKEYGFGFTAQHYSLYSNIENGYGIFTSFSTCRYRYKFDEQ